MPKATLLVLLMVTLLLLTFPPAYATFDFTAAVTGTATETWMETRTTVLDWEYRSGAGSVRNSLFVSSSVSNYTLAIEASGFGSSVTVKVFQRQFPNEWIEIYSDSCIAGSQISCKSSQSISLDWRQSYEWELTVTGCSETGCSYPSGKAELTYDSQVEVHSVVYGQPYVTSESISFEESPKNLGGFYVPFTSQHGGTLSSPQFTVSSNHSAVAIVFSDTNGSSSNSDSAELIARIFIPPLKVVSAKLNDDARADVLETALINGKLALRTHLSDGTGGFTTSDWYETGDIYKEGSRFVDVVVADVNGDGVDDIIHVRTDSEKLIFRVHVSDGTGGFTTLPWYRTGDVDCIGACFVQVLVADVNGDGRQDLVHVRTKNNRLIWRVHLANGSGGFSQRPWYQTGDQYCAGACFVQVVVADINGDGRQDLVHARTKNNRLLWRVHLANSSGGFSRQLWYQTGDQYCTDSCFVQVLVADVNGDGRQDLVHVRTDNQYLLWRVHMTDSSNSFSPQPWYRTSDQYAEDVARVGTFAAHLDSNNRNDVVHWRTDGGKIIVRSHLADLNGNFIATSQWYRTGELFAEDASRYGLLSADMDGDGLTDLLHWRTDEGFLILKAHFANGIGSYQSGSWYRAP